MMAWICDLWISFLWSGFEVPNFSRVVFRQCDIYPRDPTVTIINCTCNLDRVTPDSSIVPRRYSLLHWFSALLTSSGQLSSTTVHSFSSQTQTIISGPLRLYSINVFTETFHQYASGSYHTVGSSFFVLGLILSTDFIIVCPSYIMSHRQIISWWHFRTIAYDVTDIFHVNSIKSASIVTFYYFSCNPFCAFGSYFLLLDCKRITFEMGFSNRAIHLW